MKAMAIRLAAVAAVAVALLGGAGGPRLRAEAAGGNPYAVQITRFCRSHVFGSAESASFKLAVTLKAAGTRDVAGHPYVTLHSPVAPHYQQLAINEAPTVVLHPGESVSFVAIVKNRNLSQSFAFTVGLKEPPPDYSGSYTMTPWYASPQDIPAC